MLLHALHQTKARRGADVLLEVLESEGVEYVFGNPGTTELPLLDALLGHPHVHYVLGLQEASVVAMADGYAQAARRPAFLNLHTAGGLGHGMGNLLNAGVARTPLVVTAGQQDSRHMVTDPLLYADLEAIARPCVKWAREVRKAEQLPVLLRRAFHDAEAAPSGPVFLSLPMDVLEDVTTVPSGERSRIEHRSVAGSLELLADQLLAVTPGCLALIAGDEVYASDASNQVAAIAEMHGAPVFGSSWPSRIPFPTAHPLWAGNLPTTARDIAEVLAPFDAVFALGGKSLITILYTEQAALPKNCDVFQLSSDVTDLGRTFPTKLSLVGDIQASLEVLLTYTQNKCLADRRAYQEAMATVTQQQMQRRASARALAANVDASIGIAPIVAARELVRAIGPDVPIVDEAIATSGHVRTFLCSHSSSQYSFLRGGGLGWGMPAAVGCSLGLGRTPVVNLVGDGAAMYSPQSLWTAAHENLPVTFIVMNNREYNVLKNFMRRQPQYLSSQTQRFLAMDITKPSIDYVALAASMGVRAYRIERATEIASVVSASIVSGQPSLIEIPITSE